MLHNQEFLTRLGPGRITIIGRQPSLLTDEGQPSETQAHLLGADAGKICLLRVGTRAGATGFKPCIAPAYRTITASDGAYIDEPKSALVMQTGDCAAVVLHDKKPVGWVCTTLVVQN